MKRPSSITFGKRIVPKAVKRVGGPTGKRARMRIMQRDGFRCADCGKVCLEQDLEVDHIEPLWKTGDDSDANKQTRCKPCHKLKTATEQRQRFGNTKPEHTIFPLTQQPRSH